MSEVQPATRLHVFDTVDRPGVPAGIVVSVAENKASAKTRIHDETLADDPEHDNIGRLKDDEHYAGVTYLGTLQSLRDAIDSGDRRWVATGVPDAVVAGDLSEEQFHDIFDFLTEYVRGERQIECLEPDCGANHAHLVKGAPTEDDLQCRACGSHATMAVKPDSIDDLHSDHHRHSDSEGR